MPSSPGGWIRWAQYTLESQSRPFSPRLDHVPRGDFRIRDSKETAIDVEMMLRRSANGCGGRGPKLVADFYINELSWTLLTESEKYLFQKTHARFKAALRKAGFIEMHDDGDADGEERP